MRSLRRLAGLTMMGLGMLFVAGVVFGMSMSLTTVGSCITLGLLFGGLALLIL